MIVKLHGLCIVRLSISHSSISDSSPVSDGFSTAWLDDNYSHCFIRTVNCYVNVLFNKAL